LNLDGAMIEKPEIATQNKKRFAQFYTRPTVARILTEWCITDANVSVLDGSFGGCSFLNAAFDVLSRRGSETPANQIYGVDIDPQARTYLQELLSRGANVEQFIIDDFFNISPEDFPCERFGAVIGNPPYIRYHSISDEAQKRAIDRLKHFGIEISGRSSYWAFFLLYSIQFLRPGGRLAMVLPGAFLHTDYASQVRELLIRHFKEVTILLLNERIFEGTQEETILVCCSGAWLPNENVRIGEVASVDNLETVFNNLQLSTKTIQNKQGDGGWLRTLLESELLDIYDELVESHIVIRLGQWINTRIGVVTGNNDFFILSKTEQRKTRIPLRFLIPIIKRPSFFKGLSVTDQDLKVLGQNGHKSLLLAINQDQGSLPDSLLDYIRQGELMGVLDAQKCKARQPWYSVQHTFKSEAFMPCMAASWPRLIVNESAYTCTNNILRLGWKEERPSVDWLRLAIGTISTLSQLSAELVGRSYGGGVLKLEPNELAYLAIPLIPVEAAPGLSIKIDALLRQGLISDATKLVDETLISLNYGLNKRKLDRLRAARDKLFLRRRNHRRDARNILSN